jgi:hypothetical protein
MRTLIRVENANCTYCMNAVRDDLLARPLVHHVHLSATAGCWEVDHDHEDASELIGVLEQSLHGWQVGSNGEIVEITTNPTLSDACAWHPPTEPGTS